MPFSLKLLVARRSQTAKALRSPSRRDLPAALSPDRKIGCWPRRSIPYCMNLLRPTIPSCCAVRPEPASRISRGLATTVAIAAWRCDLHSRGRFCPRPRRRYRKPDGCGLARAPARCFILCTRRSHAAYRQNAGNQRTASYRRCNYRASGTGSPHVAPFLRTASQACQVLYCRA